MYIYIYICIYTRLRKMCSMISRRGFFCAVGVCRAMKGPLIFSGSCSTRRRTVHTEVHAQRSGCFAALQRLSPDCTHMSLCARVRALARAPPRQPYNREEPNGGGINGGGRIRLYVCIYIYIYIYVCMATNEGVGGFWTTQRCTS